MNTQLKKIVPHVGVLLSFFLLVLVYFYPSFEGKVLQQGDVSNWAGMVQEVAAYGQSSGWTNSMFSGMPTYHIGGYDSGGVNFIVWIGGESLINNVFQIRTIGNPILLLLITSYILFLCLGASWWLAALGAIATTFSSYNLIILVAGHWTKLWVLAYVPLLIAGIVLLFRQKWWMGFLTFSFGLASVIQHNHLQIAYYAAIFCAILYIGFLVEVLRKKEYKRLGITTGIFAGGVIFAILANSSALYLNYESGQTSMRGKAELTPLESAENAAPTISAVDGLDKDYVFAWSYGKAETLNLMIPNAKGGESGGSLGKDSHLYKELRAHGAQVGKEVRAQTYWGDKPFTSGPAYLGAVVCFLFLLALFIVPGRAKWWLLGASVFFIMLAWGRNLAWFNDWMYYHFPLYAKFRAVETALVITSFTFPFLAVLAIKELINTQIEKIKLTKSLYWSAGVTGGICLLMWLIPGAFFDFESVNYDGQITGQAPDWYYQALLADRKDLLASDAFRSLMYIALAAGLVFVYIQSKNRRKVLPYLAGGLIVLILCDLWTVDKRYLNDGNFMTAKKHTEQQFPKTVADEWILRDTSPSYRVLNLQGTWNESRTSYFHKSIGGYHAAKLGRYQDLIDRRLSQEENAIIRQLQSAKQQSDLEAVFANCPTLNMLNAKYIIYNTGQPPIVNPAANGNAWFVQSYRFVDTPDEEMAALQTLNPKTEAVFDRQFQLSITNYQLPATLPVDSAASIVMTAYFPNRVEYKSSSAQAALAIFSEVYYKNGWKAFIDGERVPISRANWILRALVVPAGEHEIKMVFDPDDMKFAGTMTTVFSGLLMLLLLIAIVVGLIRHPQS
ncbi:hypothetical protein [Candidatus Symbiothrix dinenymphae]|uniref:hypothetical protein n=1 Tax=Candidatus Symbiothrix dinenymphae TaxID=467085 RepID=UPI000703BE36|nr:hypothetical protein [Candidatus Symbiothrix dinenymphae]